MGTGSFQRDTEDGRRSAGGLELDGQKHFDEIFNAICGYNDPLKYSLITLFQATHRRKLSLVMKVSVGVW